MKLSRLLILGALALLFACPPDARPNPAGQATTWSDFNFIRDIAASMTHVYFATSNGITVYNKATRNWEEPLTGTEGIDHRDIQRIWTDRFGERIYARTGTDLYEYAPLFERWYPTASLPEIDNDSRYVSPPDMLIMPFGFSYGDPGVMYGQHNRTFSFNVLLDDGSGDVWIGTWGYGAGHYAPPTNVMELLPFGLLQDRVNAFWEEGDTLWVSGAVFGSLRTGVTGFDRDDLSFTYVESGVVAGFPQIDINCLTGDKDYLYIGTPDGLYVMHRPSQMVEYQVTGRSGLIHDNVISLARNGDSLFVGTEEGLTILAPEGDSLSFLYPSPLSGLRIWDILPYDSTVWIATELGVFRYFVADGRLQHFRDPQMMLTGDVYAVEIHDSSLWGISNDGALQLDLVTGRTRSHRLRIEQVWPNALAVNDSIAAIGGSRGLLFVFYTADPVFTQRFDTFDGLPSESIFCLQFDGDFLWIGSDKGLTRFWWNNPRRGY
jgi:ligand-binding sensor domain-containing protein